MEHIICSGTVRVALRPERAHHYFTPEGERAWAPGWDPAYPGDHGGVFTTHDGATIWLDLGDLRYARVTPGVQAGTVAVDLAPDNGGTRATVTYDLTALGPDADLAGFRDGFGAMMAAWEEHIAAAL